MVQLEVGGGASGLIHGADDDGTAVVGREAAEHGGETWDEMKILQNDDRGTGWTPVVWYLRWIRGVIIRLLGGDIRLKFFLSNSDLKLILTRNPCYSYEELDEI